MNVIDSHVLANEIETLKQKLREAHALIAMLIHDLATPLQILKNFYAPTDSSIVVKDSSQARACIDTIIQSLSTVREYHVAKVGKLKPSLSEVSVSNCLKSSISLYREKIHQKKIRVVIDFSGLRDLHVVADEAWLKNQVFCNLLSNAIKFSLPSNELHIQVAANKFYGIIRIRDFGTGIPIEKQKQIFQFDSSTTVKGTQGEQGSGLGLPTVKTYLELMNGKIEILPMPPDAKGTCFEVSIPISPKDSERFST